MGQKGRKTAKSVRKNAFVAANKAMRHELKTFGQALNNRFTSITCVSCKFRHLWARTTLDGCTSIECPECGHVQDLM